MRTLILILLITGSVATATEVFRWVDDSGVTHYSDRPNEDAELITLPKTPTYTQPAQQPGQRSSTAVKIEKKDEAETVIYEAVEITSPTQNQVFWNIGGLLKVTARVKPRLRGDHTLMIYLDDQMVERLTGNKREFELNQVFRGEHALRAEVHDAAGSVVGKGSSVAFTVQQTSILNQNNLIAPGPTPR